MAESWKVKNRRWHANLGMMAAVTLGLIALSCPFIAHKWELGGVGKLLKTIHYGEFLPGQWKWLWIDSQGFFLIFLVVSGWLMHKKAVKAASSAAADDPKAAGSSVTVVDLGGGSGGQVLVSKCQAAGLRAFHCPAEKFAGLNLAQERWLVLVGEAERLPQELKQQWIEALKGVKPGSVKRLEWVVEFSVAKTDAGSTWFEQVEAGLEAAGAKPLKLAAAKGEQTWMEQLLSTLAARSKTPVRAVPATKRAPVEGVLAAPESQGA